PEPQAKNPNLKIALIIGIVLVIAACGAGYYLEQQKQKLEQNFDALEKISDTMTENQVGEDSTADTSAVEEVSPEVVEAASPYTGEYDNLKGGIISITGSGNELKIDLKYNLETADKCKGEIAGTGIPLNDSIISMTTDEGCNLKLNFRSRYTIAVEESGDCKSYHGKHCLFDGVYYGK
ncbi:MAG TPA: hypothetical protein VFJ43_08270, partial [Bacteroidia bacterium]|nr:hypothetical protein [Bacteroidia bacterium]